MAADLCMPAFVLLQQWLSLASIPQIFVSQINLKQIKKKFSNNIFNMCQQLCFFFFMPCGKFILWKGFL